MFQVSLTNSRVTCNLFQDIHSLYNIMKTVTKSLALKKALRRYYTITALGIGGGSAALLLGHFYGNQLLLMIGLICAAGGLSYWPLFWPREFTISPQTLVFDSKTGCLVFDSKNFEQRFLLSEKVEFLERHHCEGEPVFVKEEINMIEVKYPVRIRDKGRIRDAVIILETSGYLEKDELVKLVEGNSGLIQDAQDRYTNEGKTSLIAGWLDHVLADFCRNYSAKDFEEMLHGDPVELQVLVRKLSRHIRDAGYDYDSLNIRFE